jgi:hypothetical protein
MPNPAAAAISKLMQLAAVSLTGPAGLVVAPLIATCAEWASEHLPEDARLLAALAKVLSHMHSDLGAQSAENLLKKFEGEKNHDLELAVAAALALALKYAERDMPKRTLDDTYLWFALWSRRLSGKEPPFNSGGWAGPVALSVPSEGDWWSEVKPQLLNWAEEQQVLEKTSILDTSKLPPELEKQLSKNLRKYTENALRQVVI